MQHEMKTEKYRIWIHVASRSPSFRSLATSLSPFCWAVLKEIGPTTHHVLDGISLPSSPFLPLPDRGSRTEMH